MRIRTPASQRLGVTGHTQVSWVLPGTKVRTEKEEGRKEGVQATPLEESLGGLICPGYQNRHGCRMCGPLSMCGV